MGENSDYIALTDYYTEDGYQAAMTLLNHSHSFTAVIAANDNVAIGAIRAFYDQGISVPGDISVASCDHFSCGTYSIPRITGISRNTAQIGSLLIHALLQTIEGSPINFSLGVASKLLVLESCAPPV